MYNSYIFPVQLQMRVGGPAGHLNIHTQTFSQDGINEITYTHLMRNRRGTKQDLPLRHCLEGEWGNTLVLRGC